MTSTRQVLNDFRQSGALHAELAPFAFTAGDAFVTKRGDIGMVLSVRGADYECMDPEELEAVARRFQAAMRTFDEQYVFYQYIVKRDNPALPQRPYPENPILEHALSARIRYLRARAAELYEIDTFFVVLRKSAVNHMSASQKMRRLFGPGMTGLFSTKGQIRIRARELEREHQVLANRVESFIVQVADVIQCRVLPKSEAWQFFREILNYDRDRAGRVGLKYDTFIDYFAADETLECHRDHLVLGNRYVRVLTLKDPPSHTAAHWLRSLQELPANFIAVSEWSREPNQAMRRQIQSARRHHHNSKFSFWSYLGQRDGAAQQSEVLKDDSCEALVAELGSALTEIDANGNHFGRFSLTVIVHGRDRAQLDRTVARCARIFSAADGQIHEERYNQLNAWLAAIPGNYRHNLRHLYLLDRNYSDLAFLFTLDAGEKENRHLGREYLAVLETGHQTPYFLNLHHKDIAHTLVLGATGSGKSFLLNFLITHLEKYAPYVFIFDLGGSYEHVTKIFGGTWLPVGVESRSFTINPFSLEPTKENLQFLFSFVKVLAGASGYEANAADDRDLYDQIESLYRVERENRRLFTLSNILNRRLREALSRWIEGGQYGSLFDNVEDNLTFARFQCFDFSGMDRYPEVLEPLLFYILHRANASIRDPRLETTFKAFVVDEAWRFLGNATIRQYITEALKTWRKHNAAMILATQSRADLVASGVEASLVESCPTRIFLSNPGIDRTQYREIFHLNGTEAEAIANLAPKGQILLKRPGMAKVLRLEVDETSYWLYTNDPYDNDRRRRVLDRYGFEKGLEILADLRRRQQTPAEKETV